ncbi:MAG: nucleotidyltransferase family protein [Chloracidobacterium sp.]|nr:nucleotidyltransferase family protein [Chloracidobacterium sp.]
MTVIENAKIGGLLLAAGGSSRLRPPKQLVQYYRTTLLRHAAKSLAESKCEPVVVVLGAEVDRSMREIADLDVNVCINRDWETGMSSSLRTGLDELLHIEPKLSGLMITLCDQPHVTTDKINLFVTEFYRSAPAVIAAEYNGITGVPALFSSELFDLLMQLEGDKGARDIIRNHKNTLRIGLPEASFDVDTQSDLQDRLSCLDVPKGS